MKKTNKYSKTIHITLWSILGVAVLGTLGFLIGPRVFSSSYSQNGDDEKVLAEEETKTEEKKKPEVEHIATPESVKAIYMSQCVAGTPSFRDKLIQLIDDTELNAVIIDIKDFSGKIAFTTDNPELSFAVSDECGARDMRDFIKRLHSKNIYVIGRITVFQDPFYTKLYPEVAVKKASDRTAVWTDYKGLSFVDVGAKDFWKYIVELSEESYALGFDELNFDYVRYPSDGNMKDIAFTHSETKTREVALEEFFSFLYEALSTGEVPEEGLRETTYSASPTLKNRPILSADLFGYTTTNVDDLGIGQLLERALPYFDYVMPMVYPSHYNKGFIGIEKPATQPYEVVKYSMDSAVRRARLLNAAEASTSTSTQMIFLREQSQKGHGNISTDQLRPWLQDFDLGATYTPEMVRTQIQATYDSGLDSWALWDAGNTYTQSALLPEDQL